MKVFLIFFFSIPAVAQDFFNVQLEATWTDSSITLGPGDVRFSDLWGFEVNDKNYAVLGSNEGSHFLEVESGVIKELAFEAGAFAGPLVQHRDYKFYKGYIYAVCDEGTSSLQIFDVSHLPDSIVKVYDSDILFTTCHNIFIDSVTAKLYACGPNGVGMKIINLADPVNPALLLNFNNLAYVHDCYVSNDTAFLNAGVDGLRVYNFANISFPQEIGVLTTYQEKGYNHSGWMNKDKTVYCFVDETEGKKIKYCRLDDGIANIEVNALFGTRNAADFVAHNIQIVKGFAFVSYYNEGFRVFDLQAKPIKEVAYFDTYEQVSNFKLHGAWGIYVFEEDERVVISDRQSGLFSFYFPFKSLRAAGKETSVIGTPFVDSFSKVVVQSDQTQALLFDIYDVKGSILYRAELVKNWINIPLNLSSGAYLYKLYNTSNAVKDSGKFIILK